MDRRPFSVMSAMPSSPGSLPAKRLHSEGWKEVQVSHPQTMPKLQPPSTARCDYYYYLPFNALFSGAELRELYRVHFRVRSS